MSICVYDCIYFNTGKVHVSVIIIACTQNLCRHVSIIFSTEGSYKAKIPVYATLYVHYEVVISPSLKFHILYILVSPAVNVISHFYISGRCI